MENVYKKIFLSTFTIRTVLSLDPKQPLETIQTPLLAHDQTAMHPRGVWPSATVQVQLPAYSVGTAQVGYSFSNGQTDHLYTLENALSAHDQTIANRGHFGATYKVQIPIVNETNKRKGIVLKLTGRGGTYSGIIQYRGQTYIIPPLQAGEQYVQLPISYSAKKIAQLSSNSFTQGEVIYL